MPSVLNDATAVKSPWEEATLVINGNTVKWGAELVLLRGQENSITVQAPAEIASALALVLVESGGLEIDASPEFEDWVSRVDGEFKWTITSKDGKSGRITLVFFSREVVAPWVNESRVISANLEDEVTLYLDGKAMPRRGANFISDKPYVLTLDYKAPEVWLGTPLAIGVVPQSGYVEGNVNCAPPFGEPTTTHKWVLTGRQLQSVTFQLKLFNEGDMSSLLTPTNRLSREIFRFLEGNGNDLSLPPGAYQWLPVIPIAFRVGIFDENGAPIVGVEVTFTDTPNGGKYVTKSDSNGFAQTNPVGFGGTDVVKVKAVAALAAGNTPVEMLLRLKPASETGSM